jgi:segregation and condensation protein B
MEQRFVEHEQTPAREENLSQQKNNDNDASPVAALANDNPDALPRPDFRALSRREQISAVEALLFASEESLTAQMIYEILVVGEDGDKNDKEKNDKEKNDKQESPKKERGALALAAAQNGSANGSSKEFLSKEFSTEKPLNDAGTEATPETTRISRLRITPPEGMTEENLTKLSANPSAETQEETQETALEEHKEDNSRRPTNEAEEWIEGLIAELNAELQATARAFRVVSLAREGAKGFQFATNPEHGELLARLVKSKSKKRLSKAGLETLAIIAYRQPISKPEVEIIRGVSSSEIINRLLEKNLITIVGRSESVGKPLLYGTTDEFLRLFGLHSLADLPKPRELEELMAERADILETERPPAITLPATPSAASTQDLTQHSTQASTQDSTQDLKRE